jgi:chromosome segregation ATPase
VQSTLTNTQDDLDIETRKLSSASELNTRLESEISRLTSELKQSKEDLSSEKSNSSALRQKEQDLITVLTSSNQKIAELNDVIQQEKSDLVGANDKIKELSNLLQVERQEKQGITKKLENVNSQSALTKAELERTVSTASLEKLQFEGQLTDLTSELKTKRDESDSLKSQLTTAISNIEHANETNAKLHQTIRKKEAEMTQLSESLASERAMREALEATAAKLKAADRVRQQQHEAAAAELRQQLGIARNGNRRIEEQLEQIRVAVGASNIDDIRTRTAALCRDSEALAALKDVVPPGSDSQGIKRYLEEMQRSREILKQFERKFGGNGSQEGTTMTRDPGFPLWYTNRLRTQSRAMSVLLVCVVLMWYFSR